MKLWPARIADAITCRLSGSCSANNARRLRTLDWTNERGTSRTTRPTSARIGKPVSGGDQPADDDYAEHRGQHDLRRLDVDLGQLEVASLNRVQKPDLPNDRSALE